MPVLHKNTPEKITQREGAVCLVVTSPWGDIVVRGEKDVIRSIRFQPGQIDQNIDMADWAGSCQQQINAYCAGELQTFDLPIKPLGSDFQQQVWQALQQIPYGELSSYQQLAEAIGNPGSVRAVASANARNPISLVIPCHRVIGSDKALRGYAGGIETKARLLELEGHQIQQGEISLASKVLTRDQQELGLC